MNISLPAPVFPIITLLGQVLVHFLWQGALIAGLLALGLGATRKQSSTVRHHLACLALVLMAVSPLFTAAWLIQFNPETGFLQPASPNAVPTNHFTGAGPASTGDASLGGFSWLPVVTFAWLAGVGVLFLRLLGGWGYTVLRLSGRATPAPTEWQERIRALQEKFQVCPGRTVRLLESLRAEGPLVIGCLKPVILFPAGLWVGLPASQVEALLLHELAHIRHHDFLINLAQRLVETLLFYHPAVWWVSDQIRQERELRCDDWVASIQGNGTSLANALLTLTERGVTDTPLALAAGGGSLAERIRRLVGASPSESAGKPHRWRRVFPLAIAIVLGFLAVRWSGSSPVYQSTARVRIAPFQRTGEGAPYDPYSVLTSIEIIRSADVLSGVSQQLDLPKQWSVTPEEAVRRLRAQVQARQYRNTDLIEISASSPSREEAALLANAVAEQFVSRESRRRADQRSVAEAMAERHNHSLDELIAGQEAEFRKSYPSPPLGMNLDYVEKLKDLEMLREIKRQKWRESVLRQMESPATPPQSAEIIDSAEPALRPSRRFASLW